MVLPSGLNATLLTRPSLPSSVPPASRVRLAAAASNKHATPPVEDAVVTDRDGLAVPAECHGVDAALLDYEVLRAAGERCPIDGVEQAPPPAAAEVVTKTAMVSPSGPECHAVDAALLDYERCRWRSLRPALQPRRTLLPPLRRRFRRGRPYPTTIVLPSGLNATLLTLPSLTSSVPPASRVRLACRVEQSRHAAAVSGRNGLAVGAERHALDAALLDFGSVLRPRAAASGWP